MSHQKIFKYCAECGSSLETDVKFCTSCGHVVHNAGGGNDEARDQRDHLGSSHQSSTPAKPGPRRTTGLVAVAVLAVIGVVAAALLVEEMPWNHDDVEDSAAQSQQGEFSDDDSAIVDPAAGSGANGESDDDSITAFSDNSSTEDGTAAPDRDIEEVDFDCNPVREIPQNECVALVAVYNALGGPIWRDQRGWLEDHMPCGWREVFCDDGHVVELDLRTGTVRVSDDNFQARIPAEISGLRELRELRFTQAYNARSPGILGGELPPEIGELQELRSFHVVDMRLGGPIPPEIKQLENLEVLTLRDNQISGSIPAELGELRKLEVVDLSGNRLEDSIPEDLSNLVSAIELDLSMNALTGEIPPELGDLINLESLDLSGNLLHGALPQELAHLSNLRRLLVANNTNLDGPVPVAYSRLEYIHEFDHLDGTALCEPADPSLQDWLDEVAGARSIELCDDSVAIPTPIPHRSFTFSCDSVGEIPASECEALVALHRDAGGTDWRARDWLESTWPCDWSGVGCTDGHVTSLSLTTVAFPAGLSGTIPPEIGDLQYLETLNLSLNDIAGEVPPEIGTLNELRELQLRSNRLGGQIPPELGALENLETLNLSENELSGSIPEELAQLGSLERLLLEDNNLSGPLPIAFQGLDLSRMTATENEVCVPAEPGLRSWVDDVLYIPLFQDTLPDC